MLLQECVVTKTHCHPVQEPTDADYVRKRNVSNVDTRCLLSLLDRKPIEKTWKIPLCDLFKL